MLLSSMRNFAQRKMKREKDFNYRWPLTMASAGRSGRDLGPCSPETQIGLPPPPTPVKNGPSV